MAGLHEVMSLHASEENWNRKRMKKQEEESPEFSWSRGLPMRIHPQLYRPVVSPQWTGEQQRMV